ncbi:MAG: LytTR family DNA-binding domain-containing protein [Caldimonas sp.]
MTGSPTRPRALVAEDEPLLAATLQAELARIWPELEITALVGDGESAVERTLAVRPEVCFLDIRMPVMSGLEAAQALAEDWPDDGTPFPLIVFVTAFDQYALQAFERAAFDYVLKPVEPVRLAQTCARLRQALDERARAASLPPAVGADARPVDAAGLTGAVEQLRALLSVAPVAAPVEPLRVVQAGVGNAIHMVPIDEVVYFEAADKYVRVMTAAREYLIRVSLRDLLPRLDATRFWQIHRGTVVRAEAIASAERDESGKVTLRLSGRPEKLVVSRLHTQRFKAM